MRMRVVLVGLVVMVGLVVVLVVMVVMVMVVMVMFVMMVVVVVLVRPSLRISQEISKPLRKQDGNRRMVGSNLVC